MEKLLMQMQNQKIRELQTQIELLQGQIKTLQNENKRLKRGIEGLKQAVVRWKLRAKPEAFNEEEKQRIKEQGLSPWVARVSYDGDRMYITYQTIYPPDMDPHEVFRVLQAAPLHEKGELVRVERRGNNEYQAVYLID